MFNFLDTIFLNSLDHPSLDIRINRANFSWNSSDNLESNDLTLKDIDLSITRGSLVLILGRVGSKIRDSFTFKMQSICNFSRWQNDITQ